MKIFSIKRLVGLAAIYGAVRYAQKHGGPRNAFNELLGKAKDLAGAAKDETDTTSIGSRSFTSESERSKGGAFSSAYAASDGVGGTKNHS